MVRRYERSRAGVVQCRGDPAAGTYAHGIANFGRKADVTGHVASNFVRAGVI
jgi:hypothetical protein